MHESSAHSDAPRHGTRRSLTVLPVGQGGAPEPCLQRCLDGQPEALAARGCAWLRASLAGGPDPSLLEDGRCPQGLAVAAEVSALHEQPAVVVSMLTPDDETPADRQAGELTQLRAENEALADEVLRNYEQLSLIFDFTQRIANITHVEQLETLLLQRIGDLLRTGRIRVHSADAPARVFDVQNGTFEMDRVPRPVERVAWLNEVGTSTNVRVRHDADGQAMAGVLQRLDDRRDVILVERSHEDQEFNAGDTQILEALLTLGGQILANNELHQRLRQMSIEATRALVSAIDKKDHYTSGHSERVGFLARLTGVQLGLHEDELELLEWAGLLHDVGKIGVPEEILCKPGRLTDEEFEIVKKHPEMGYEILKPISDFKHILDGVLHHHENPDGSGYPYGLVGDQIPLFAGVLHVVDVFDALTSRRSYRDAFTIEKALGIINSEAGTKLNAEFVSAFLRALAAFRENEPGMFASMYPVSRATSEVAS